MSCQLSRLPPILRSASDEAGNVIDSPALRREREQQAMRQRVALQAIKDVARTFWMGEICEAGISPGRILRVVGVLAPKNAQNQAVIQEFQSRKKDESWDYAKNKVAVTREFLDEHFIERLVNMKTHPKVGDLPIVKMFETGYKRTGDIQSSRIVQQQGQIGQANLTGANAFEVYESAWLRKRKEKMNKELEEKYQDSGRPPAMPDS